MLFGNCGSISFHSTGLHGWNTPQPRSAIESRYDPPATTPSFEPSSTHSHALPKRSKSPSLSAFLDASLCVFSLAFSLTHAWSAQFFGSTPDCSQSAVHSAAVGKR